MKSSNRGFTLIELLVVIAIIGILSSVVLASLNSARVKGRDARRISDIKQIQLALELFYDSQQSYPLQASAAAASTSLVALVSNNYISAIPTDPTNIGTSIYTYISANLDGSPCSTAPCPSYMVKAVIEGGAGAVPAGDVDDAVGTAAAALGCDDPAYCMRP